MLRNPSVGIVLDGITLKVENRNLQCVAVLIHRLNPRIEDKAPKSQTHFASKIFDMIVYRKNHWDEAFQIYVAIY